MIVTKSPVLFGSRGGASAPARHHWRQLIHLAVLALGLGLTTASLSTGGGRDITFFVASDSHFGAPGMDQANLSMVEQLNGLPGTEFPTELGGRVDRPRGLLFLGDMTDSSQPEELRRFEEVYGLTGSDGLLRYPVFEAIGNHDFIGDSPVISKVTERHGALVYSWDWDDLHFVCLDLHPDPKNLDWLARDLAKVGRKRPTVIFFHYSILGPYSEMWSEENKTALARTIEGYNVIAVFHGHYHRAGRYTWQGHDVFLPGSPRHSSHAFIVVRVEAKKLAVAYWDFDRRAWSDSFVKPITR